MANEVGEAAQRCRALEERLTNASWERFYILNPSEATGNWRERTFKPNVQPLQTPLKVQAPSYGVSRLNNLQWRGFPPPPHTWTDREVRDGVLRAAEREEEARQEKLRQRELAQNDVWRQDIGSDQG